MMTPLPTFGWDPRSGRYRDGRTGRYLAGGAIRGAVAEVIAGSADEMAFWATALLRGSLLPEAFARAMRRQVTALHWAVGAAAFGGWSSVGPAQEAWMRQALTAHLTALDGFMADIAAGRQKPSGVLFRTRLYADAGRATFAAATAEVMRGVGMRQERNVLGVAEHCAGCLAAAAQGWVPTGTLPPIGARDCGPNDHCYLEYREGVVPA